MEDSFKVHFPERDITFRITKAGQEMADKFEDIGDMSMGELGYELISSENVIYCELLCGGEVIESLTFGEATRQMEDLQ